MCGAIDLHLGWKGFLTGFWKRNPSVSWPSNRRKQIYFVREIYDYAEIQKAAKKCSSVAEVVLSRGKAVEVLRRWKEQLTNPPASRMPQPTLKHAQKNFN